ncbi:MAG: ATP-grasp domain-containing protein [Bacteroidales bacterium]|jgi:carbamoyl-phosphate synthase large subunit|nr:ATP-grasp domain-containing protein [Bacteroidales bacterium]
MKKKITIAITGLNNTDNPGPGIPIIRGLRESEIYDVRIIGLVYENLEPGIYMDGMVDKTYLIPYPSSGKEVVWDRIMEIHERENLDVIFPNFDAELFTFMLLEKDLKAKGIHMFLPTEEQFEERQKANLNTYGEKYGIDIPKSIALGSLNEVAKVKDKLDFPVLVKGKFYDAYVAYNTDQIISHYNKISSKWGLPVIIQEFIKGTEVNVVALGDGNGNTIGAVPMRKQYITDKGKAWGGIVIDDEKLLKITRDLISKTKWRGGMELELILTSKGEYYLIEINPRLPAWVYLAVGAGQNLPEAMVTLALGEEVTPYDSYKTGTMFIRYSYDLIKNISDFEKLSIFGEL